MDQPTKFNLQYFIKCSKGDLTFLYQLLKKKTSFIFIGHQLYMNCLHSPNGAAYLFFVILFRFVYEETPKCHTKICLIKIRKVENFWGYVKIFKICEISEFCNLSQRHNIYALLGDKKVWASRIKYKKTQRLCVFVPALLLTALSLSDNLPFAPVSTLCNYYKYTSVP